MAAAVARAPEAAAPAAVVTASATHMPKAAMPQVVAPDAHGTAAVAAVAAPDGTSGETPSAVEAGRDPRPTAAASKVGPKTRKPAGLKVGVTGAPPRHDGGARTPVVTPGASTPGGSTTTSSGGGSADSGSEGDVGSDNAEADDSDPSGGSDSGSDADSDSGGSGDDADSSDSGASGADAESVAASVARKRQRRIAASGASTGRCQYSVGPGNNSRLLLHAFRHRRGWAPAASSQGKAAATAAMGGNAAKGSGGCHFYWDMYKKKSRFDAAARAKYARVINHFEHNSVLTTKKGLLKSLQRFYAKTGSPHDVFDVVPPSYCIGNLEDDGPFGEFSRHFESIAKDIASAKAGSSPGGEGGAADVGARDGGGTGAGAAKGRDDGGRRDSDGSAGGTAGAGDESSGSISTSASGKNVWIVKPACMTNRGMGITVVNSVEEVRKIVSKGMSKKRLWIVQKYMEQPLLVRGRKFDVRCFVLVVAARNGKGVQAYLYKEGYVRTSVKKYSLANLKDKFVHLTNDAIQNKSANYGKFEAGNKLTYEQFAAVVEEERPGCGALIQGKVLPRIRELVDISVRAVADRINRKRRPHCFELYGYDFMIDNDFSTWLIEVNSNPCLDLACPYLAGMLPRMIEHTMQLTVDKVFPPMEPLTRAASVGFGGASTGSSASSTTLSSFGGSARTVSRGKGAGGGGSEARATPSAEEMERQRVRKEARMNAMAERARQRAKDKAAAAEAKRAMEAAADAAAVEAAAGAVEGGGVAVASTGDPHADAIRGMLVGGGSLSVGGLGASGRGGSSDAMVLGGSMIRVHSKGDMRGPATTAALSVNAAPPAAPQRPPGSQTAAGRGANAVRLNVAAAGSAAAGGSARAVEQLLSSSSGAANPAAPRPIRAPGAPVVSVESRQRMQGEAASEASAFVVASGNGDRSGGGGGGAPSGSSCTLAGGARLGSASSSPASSRGTPRASRKMSGTPSTAPSPRSVSSAGSNFGRKSGHGAASTTATDLVDIRDATDNAFERVFSSGAASAHGRR